MNDSSTSFDSAGPPQAPGPSEQAGPRRRRRTMAAMAIMVAVLPFLILEAGLRLFDVGAAETDVHDGVDQGSALFELDSSDSVYRTSLSKARFFVSQEFPVRPEPREYRIFVLGGSTVQGRPFSAETSFCQWLQLTLQHQDASRKYRCINCGGISYASYRLRHVLQEVLDYQPDLIVLATGHNEFLEDRTYSDVRHRSKLRRWLERKAAGIRTVLLIRRLCGYAPRIEPDHETEPASDEVETRLDDAAGYASYHRDPEWREQVRQQYQDSVTEMIHQCRSADVPLLLVKLGCNLRDCPPFKSELPSGISTEQQQEWQLNFDQASQQHRTNPEQALSSYQKAQTIDADHALVSFRIADCEEKLNQADSAAGSYVKACDLDVCPLRITTELQETLQSIAEQEGVPLVNADATVRELSAELMNFVPGYDTYLDHVHPTIEAHRVIGEAIARDLLHAGILQLDQTGTLADAGPIERQKLRAHIASLPSAYFSNGGRRIGWLEGWAQRQRLSEEVNPVTTDEFARAAVRFLELDDRPKARSYLQRALELNAGTADVLLRHSARLYATGLVRQAMWILDELEQAGARTNQQQTQDSLVLARLVMACDQKLSTATVAIRDAHMERLPEIVANDRTGWREILPNVQQQAAEVTE